MVILHLNNRIDLSIRYWYYSTFAFEAQEDVEKRKKFLRVASRGVERHVNLVAFYELYRHYRQKKEKKKKKIVDKRRKMFFL